MRIIAFTKEVLLEEIPKVKEQFSWARRNMLNTELNTPQHQKWFDLMLHLGLQVIDMQEMAKVAPSEIRK